MTTEQILIERYGPLLTMGQLAELLHRSRDGLRLTLRGHSTLATALTEARVRIGRRVHFRAGVVAKILDGEIQA